MPQLIKFNCMNIWSNRRFIRPGSRLSNPEIRGGAGDSQEFGQKAKRSFSQGVQENTQGFFALGGVRMALITKHKIITTRMALIALLPPHKSVLDRVSLLTILTSDHMPSLLSTERSMEA